MAEDALRELLQALRCLPGVGERSAQRMAMHLLERDRQGGMALSQALGHAMQHIQHCQRCRNFTEHALCSICADPHRSDAVLCVVETPSDVLAIEAATAYSGRYFVMMGRLSPLDGIGPESLGLDQLDQGLQAGTVEELVIATNTTVEGEATAHYLTDMAARRGVRVSRLAQGLPLGGELEHTDRSTLAHAFATRLAIK